MTAQCRYGHDFTPENTLRNTLGARVCRECKRIRDTNYRNVKRVQVTLDGVSIEGAALPRIKPESPEAYGSRRLLEAIHAYWAKHHKEAA